MRNARRVVTVVSVLLIGGLIVGCGGGGDASAGDRGQDLAGSVTTASSQGSSAPSVSPSTTIGYGPRPVGMDDDWPAPILPLPDSGDVVWRPDLSVTFGDIGDSDAFRLTYDAPSLTRSWCTSYFDRVLAGGITKTLILDDEDMYTLLGRNLAVGFEIIVDCDLVERTVLVVQINPKSPAAAAAGRR